MGAVRRAAYDPWEFESFLDSCHGFTDFPVKVAAALMRYQGLHQQEIRAARWGDVLRNGSISSLMRVPPRDRGVVVGRVHIHPVVKTILEEWHNALALKLIEWNHGLLGNQTPIMYSRKVNKDGEHILAHASLSRKMSEVHKRAKLRGGFSVHALIRAGAEEFLPDVRRAHEWLRHKKMTTSCEYLGLHDIHSNRLAAIIHLCEDATSDERKAVLAWLRGEI